MSTILIGGGTGLVGSRLSAILKSQGHTVLHLSRRKNLSAPYPAYQWDINAGTIDQAAVEQADYIINLAGAGIADARWTKARKQLIIDSRVKSTALLKQAVQACMTKPKAFISASAIGYYGDRGEELLHENAAPGNGFLAESTQAWENAVSDFAQTGIRTAALRTGIVLSTKGGALEKTLIPYMFRVGSYFGNGQQWFSWIHIDDLCQMFIHALNKDSVEGFYNAASPNPARNKPFTKAIAQAKGIGALMLPAPEFMLRIPMGEMADVVFSSVKVSSEKIEATGFQFKYPDLVSALKDVLAVDGGDKK